MIAMERFIQRSFILMILTVWGCLHSEMPFYLLFVSGILLCMICERSLLEEEHGIYLGVQFILSLVFVAFTGEYLSYLLFYLLGGELPLKRKRNREEKEIREDVGIGEEIFLIGKSYSFLFPSILYFFVQILIRNQGLPEVMLRAFILAGICLILFVFQQLIEKYIIARSQISKALSIMAVNEMYAKKLNQELVIKNYLTDKTARLEERENISRNIHNSVGHSITAAVMTLDAADMLFDAAPDKAREKMNTANHRIRNSLESIRQAVRVLDHENKFVMMSDFLGELTAVTDSFVMDTMIKIYTDFGNVSMDVVIPHEHTEFLTGAVQELLSNGVRHGKADVFTVTLTADSRHIKIKVTDNGKSDFSDKNQRERIENGFGLKKMISYVKRCGGRTYFSNDNGFKAEILLEFQKGEENEAIKDTFSG
ncbi:MAG: hypothetical protein IJA10_08355 [Lachnospiraceae bacterium]|nr:hypothetical protein [Lachnospiraceae bacterium]